jgi:hypothetical protein
MLQMLTQVFYRLVDNPEYVEPLRKEVEAVVAEEGWTKAGIDKMHKFGSFIREMQRLDVQGICSSAPILIFSVAEHLLLKWGYFVSPFALSCSPTG